MCSTKTFFPENWASRDLVDLPCFTKTQSKLTHIKLPFVNFLILVFNKLRVFQLLEAVNTSLRGLILISDTNIENIYSISNGAVKFCGGAYVFPCNIYHPKRSIHIYRQVQGHIQIQ
jgi:hypothetical protein